MNIHNIDNFLKHPETEAFFAKIYGKDKVEEEQLRYKDTALKFYEQYKKDQFTFFSSPGRTETGGNHTDHNNGQVLAASVSLDVIAAAAANGEQTIHITSEGYEKPFCIDLSQIRYDPSDDGTTSLLKGILHGMRKQGYKISGFSACLNSTVPAGAGISSSAAFEMLICRIIDSLFNEGKADIVSYAKAGQYAENEYWGKSSGLLDQIACAAGGFTAIDFQDEAHPCIHRIDIDLSDMGYDLVLVNTGKSHGNMNQEYSSIPEEMKSIATFFGKHVLREIEERDVLENIKVLRETRGDRAVLRALHFFEENKRVEIERKALEEKDVDTFLEAVRESGDSSWKWLQNCYCAGNTKEQSICVALALTRLYLAKKNCGACRVHGGGFAGVIAVYIKKEYTDHYISYIDGMLQPGSGMLMHIRPEGTFVLDDDTDDLPEISAHLS